MKMNLKLWEMGFVKTQLDGMRETIPGKVWLLDIWRFGGFSKYVKLRFYVQSIFHRDSNCPSNHGRNRSP
jgi:hypothetical protein